MTGDNPIIELQEGKYVIGMSALKQEVDEVSVMADYLAQTAVITHMDKTTYLSIMLMNHQIIKGFQIKDKDNEWIQSMDQKVNEETNKRFEMFKLPHLSQTLHARVQYEIEHEGEQIKGDEQLRLTFDEESIENAE